MSDNPTKEQLSVSSPCTVQRVSVEGIGNRDQVWVHVKHIDGSLQTYFNYLDEGYTVVLQQINLLKEALVHPNLKLIVHYQEVSSAKRFHAVTLFRED